MRERKRETDSYLIERERERAIKNESKKDRQCEIISGRKGKKKKRERERETDR